jgi:hypothetical protein
VKRRWGRGHEDVLPLLQAEKLWGDVSAVVDTNFVRVESWRGQQLKDVAQLDAWMRSNAFAKVAALCGFGS